ncbi:hypothetical protein CCAX7_61700 [Capsulimonas corticalis]|uniref:Uncharacterized protein n=1 Tax=Capsulimonas corticalis TaxID=2219043 RepID=A0A402CWC0_9BACT|nr:hypothetical protein [Capsulimonas corticalis]BDI34119.1 hypothetical protein CCAX7_61700 [Capsulimonas corticalis]
MQHNRENLNRAAKILIDLQLAQSVDAAYAMLGRYAFTIVVGKDAVRTESGQVCLLTMANAGARACAGGVRIVGVDGDERLVTGLGSGQTLGQAIQRLGGQIAGEAFSNAPLVLLGDCTSQGADVPAIRVTYGGWSGGVLPAEDGFRLPEDSMFPLAAVLAGALAVSECFAYLLGRDRWAGRRSLGLSLAMPGTDWRHGEGLEPYYLPSGLWLLGLGHLGQAYAWTLAALPYPDSKALVCLQDDDHVTLSTPSTSVLTYHRHIGHLKTRVVSRWLEARGFATRLVERRFDGRLLLADADPRILLAGVDNLSTRRLLESPGFALSIDAGLGSTAADYDEFFVQTFTNRGKAAVAFPDARRTLTSEEKVDRNRAAYEALGLDRCGIVLAADAAAGVPFVGLTVSCLVIAEAIRAIAGGNLIDTTVGSLRSIVGIDSFSHGTKISNPGFIIPRSPLGGPPRPGPQRRCQR